MILPTIVAFKSCTGRDNLPLPRSKIKHLKIIISKVQVDAVFSGKFSCLVRLYQLADFLFRQYHFLCY